MKKSRVLAMMLVVVMVVATMSTAAFAVTPPANAKVRVTEKTVTATFSEDQTKVWDIWDTQGNFGSYTTTGDTLNITGGEVPFVVLSGFGSDLSNVNEIVVEYKTASTLKMKLRIREKGSSAEVVLPATGGEFVKASLSMANFEGGSLTADDLKAFKSVYDSTEKKYTSTAMLYFNSSDASIKSLNAYWYSYTSESSQVRAELSTNFPTKNSTWGSWGIWTGGGTTSVAAKAEWIEGANEDGVGYALTITGGNTGSGSYAGCQYAMPNTFDLTAVDAVRFRYKSTGSIKVLFQRAYQIEVGETIPAAEREIIEGLLGDGFSEYFDENYKCIKRYKKETGSGKTVSLPSTGGVWKTSDAYPIDKFGTQAFLKTLKSVIANKSFAPNYMLRFEGHCYGTSDKYFTLGGVTGLWYEKRPTMSALSFDVNGEESEYLDLGKIDVNVELNNASTVDINGSVLMVALYEGNKLIDMDVKLVDTPALNTSGTQTLSVDLNAAELLDEHKVCVMLWDSAATMDQITELAFMDAYGYTTAN